MKANPGEEVFRRMLAGPSGGPTHNSSICDCVTLLDHELSRCKERAGPREWQISALAVMLKFMRIFCVTATEHATTSMRSHQHCSREKPVVCFNLFHDSRPSVFPRAGGGTTLMIRIVPRLTYRPRLTRGCYTHSFNVFP